MTSAAAAPTVTQALRSADALGLERIDTWGLLTHLMDRPRSWLIAHDAEPLPAAAWARFLDLAQRRARGEPLAYLTGEKGFHRLTLRVTPDVLVPRPETEGLVDWALELLQGMHAPQVLDLGTGSGAIALAIAQARPDAVVTATDASPAALAIARENAHRLNLRVQFHSGDWWEAVDTQARHHVIASNPPYIAGGDPHLPALRHEPMHALTPGGDGLGALRVLASGAPRHLRPGGWLLLEHGHDQGAAVRRLLAEAGLVAIETRRDLAGHERCTGGQAHDGAPAPGFAV